MLFRRLLTAPLFACGLLLATAHAQPARPGPYDLPPDVAYARTLLAGTRTLDGAPGPSLWESTARYAIEATVDARSNRLDGQ